jgi:hypothetical protein
MALLIIVVIVTLPVIYKAMGKMDNENKKGE